MRMKSTRRTRAIMSIVRTLIITLCTLEQYIHARMYILYTYVYRIDILTLVASSFIRSINLREGKKKEKKRKEKNISRLRIVHSIVKSYGIYTYIYIIIYVVYMYTNTIIPYHYYNYYYYYSYYFYYHYYYYYYEMILIN